MSIVSTDLVAYGCVYMPEDDTSPYGGDMDDSLKITFTDIAATSTCAIWSSTTGDLQHVFVRGRLSDGTIITDDITLAGTGKVAGFYSFERILSAACTGAHSGTVTVARNNSPTYDVIGTMEVGVTGFKRLFNKSSSSPTGTKTYYERICISNNHTGLALLGAIVSEVASGGYSLIDFTLDNTQTASWTGTNRLTAPLNARTLGGSGVFDSNPKNVPGTDISAQSYIGVWLKMVLSAGAAAQKSTYTLQIDGTST